MSGDTMAPFSIPTPSIVPLRLPIFGGPKSIDTSTEIQLLCETYLDHEIFYTIDGTKPQPYAGIVQGNKTLKYSSPFSLPPGKITIRAIAINANIHTMCSSIVTKCFEVLKVDSGVSVKKKTPLKYRENCDKNNRKSKCEDRACVMGYNKLNSKVLDCNENNIHCLENAFIDTLDAELKYCALEETLEDKTDFTFHDTLDEDISEASGSVDESEYGKSYTNLSGFGNLESLHFDVHSSEDPDKFCQQRNEKPSVDIPETPLNRVHSPNRETQFCCMKCDMTLQQCFLCNKMNAVSSKFCIECGTQLIQVCVACKQHNPSIALFCQYCGKKLVSSAVKLDFSSKMDSSVMAKPRSKNASIQKSFTLVDKGTQTCIDKTPSKKSPSKREKKEMPPHSPGRGYWHLQLDYICNHLKTHAYNNLEFRKTISEPSLCNFKSAHVTKDNENVTVTVVFSPLSHAKCNSDDSKASESKGSS